MKNPIKQPASASRVALPACLEGRLRDLRSPEPEACAPLSSRVLSNTRLLLGNLPPLLLERLDEYDLEPSGFGGVSITFDFDNETTAVLSVAEAHCSLVVVPQNAPHYGAQDLRLDGGETVNKILELLS